MPASAPRSPVPLLSLRSMQPLFQNANRIPSCPRRLWWGAPSYANSQRFSPFIAPLINPCTTWPPVNACLGTLRAGNSWQGVDQGGCFGVPARLPRPALNPCTAEAAPHLETARSYRASSSGQTASSSLSAEHGPALHNKPQALSPRTLGSMIATACLSQARLQPYLQERSKVSLLAPPPPHAAAANTAAAGAAIARLDFFTAPLPILLVPAGCAPLPRRAAPRGSPAPPAAPAPDGRPGAAERPGAGTVLRAAQGGGSSGAGGGGGAPQHLRPPGAVQGTWLAAWNDAAKP